MSQTQPLLPLSRSQVIAGLAHIRQEWTETLSADGKEFTSSPEGYLLHDVAEAIGLTPDEEAEAIGAIAL